MFFRLMIILRSEKYIHKLFGKHLLFGIRPILFIRKIHTLAKYLLTFGSIDRILGFYRN